MSFQSEVSELGCSVTRGASCSGLRLGASTLRQQFPWLIFVHTSAVGMLADVTNKGVNDAGAFFCLSGTLVA